MKRLKTMIVAVLALCQLPASAQLLNLRLGTDALVESAIKDAVVTVESRYRVTDNENGRQYGRNGQDYFNQGLQLGCLTDNGVVTTADVLTPWDGDKLFDRYRKDPKYSPQLDDRLIVKHLAADTTQYLDIKDNLIWDADSALVMVKYPGVPGLCPADTAGAVSNWIVWVKESAAKSNEAPFNIVRKSLDGFGPESVLEAPKDGPAYLGALYVSASVLQTGTVRFTLTGMAVAFDGKWHMLPVGNFCSGHACCGDRKAPCDAAGTQDELTPVDNQAPAAGTANGPDGDKGKDKGKKKSKEKSKKKN